MSRSRLLHALRFALLIALLVGHATPVGAVLCVAERGHHAIELVAAETCHGAGEMTVAGTHDVACPDACTDTPLRAGAEIRSPGASDLGSQTAALVSFAATPAAAHRAVAAPCSPLVMTRSSAVVRLRSTVLLR